ncbi:MAG: histidinol-phosphatase HisJ family protein [Acidimicrobiia bacterium]|nr:histidinol-phosphatase HisJ family protein [Acidimicrobiia bacterium]
MGDYHVHLHDHGAYTGTGPPLGEYPPGHIESYVEQAHHNGVAEVGFTEHLYRCVESIPVLGEFWADEPRRDLAEETEVMVREDRTLSLEAYVTAVQDAKDRGLPVKLGLEVDFFPDTIDAVMALLEPYPWDFLIGAIHWIGGWSVDYGVSAHEFDRRGIRQAYEDYFRLETQLAASGVVDVLAHVDVVKRFGHVLPSPPLDLYQEVVAAAAATDTAVEVSSAGLYKPVGEIYPAVPFLEMFHRSGVPITLASDAHAAEECGRGVSRLAEMAQTVGYTEYLVFDQRRPTARSFA